MSGTLALLSAAELTAAIQELNAGLVSTSTARPGWVLQQQPGQADKLTREFQFADFVTAFGFMAQAAIIAERMNHHPEWFNVYRSVSVQLTTHDAQGLTRLDIELAEAMNRIASSLPG